ncbi:unnamed protein product, partial [Didymodactylos carnosus]
LVKFPFNFKPIQYFDPQVHKLDIISQQYVALCEDTEGETKYFSNNEQQLIALDVKGDGNCLYHCITLLGEMADHYTVELRVRNIIELAMNADAYLQFYKLYDTNLKAYIVRSMLYDRRWAEPWDLFGLSTVLNCNIRSVFPNLNTFTNIHPSAPLPPQKVMNKTFKPRQNIATNTILIMWSRGISPEDWILYSTEDIWAPNHYVPLIKPRSLNTTSLISYTTKNMSRHDKDGKKNACLQETDDDISLPKKSNRLEKCDASDKRGITFNVRNLIKADQDFSKEYLVDNFVKDVENILLQLSHMLSLSCNHATLIIVRDTYSTSNIRQEISKQLHFLKRDCERTFEKKHVKKELCWKHTILLVLDVKKNLNVDAKYNDWLNPNFEHVFQVDNDSGKDDQGNVENRTDVTVEDPLSLNFEQYPNYVRVSMPRTLISYIFADSNNINNAHYQELLSIIMNYLMEKDLKNDTKQRVLETCLKWTLRTAYATRIKSLFTGSENNMSSRINFMFPLQSGTNIQEQISTRSQTQRLIHSTTVNND